MRAAGVQRQHAEESGQESELPGQVVDVAERRLQISPGRHDDGAAERVDVAETDALPRVDRLSGARTQTQHALDHAAHVTPRGRRGRARVPHPRAEMDPSPCRAALVRLLHVAQARHLRPTPHTR